VAYLCLGWPETNDTTPELETSGWDTRRGHLPVETR
jgi:5,6-dimethylbenzimidazole synthase